MARRRRRRKLPTTIRLPRIYRRHPVVSAVVFVLLVLVWLDRSGTIETARAPVGTDWERYHDRVFAVVNVVDGDTFDLDAPDKRYDATRIRLWGVDTPEVAGSPGGAMYWGDRASAFAKTTLLDQTVRIALIEGKTRDKYERLLAYAYLASTGEMFNALLVRRGHAYADTRFAHPHKKAFQDAEKRARGEHAGLWQNVTVEQMPYWRQRLEPKQRR